MREKEGGAKERRNKRTHKNLNRIITMLKDRKNRQRTFKESQVERREKAERDEERRQEDRS